MDCKPDAEIAIARLLLRGSYPKLDAQPDCDTPDQSEVWRCKDYGEEKIKKTTVQAKN